MKTGFIIWGELDTCPCSQYPVVKKKCWPYRSQISAAPWRGLSLRRAAGSPVLQHDFSLYGAVSWPWHSSSSLVGTHPPDICTSKYTQKLTGSASASPHCLPTSLSLSLVLHAGYCLSKNNLAAGDAASKDCKYFQMVSEARGLITASLKGRFLKINQRPF